MWLTYAELLLTYVPSCFRFSITFWWPILVSWLRPCFLRYSYSLSFSFSPFVWLLFFISFFFFLLAVLLYVFFAILLYPSLLLLVVSCVVTVLGFRMRSVLFLICGDIDILLGLYFEWLMLVSYMLFRGLIWRWDLFLLCGFLWYVPYPLLSAHMTKMINCWSWVWLRCGLYCCGGVIQANITLSLLAPPFDYHIWGRGSGSFAGLLSCRNDEKNIISGGTVDLRLILADTIP
jgi:hypothetical protein